MAATTGTLQLIGKSGRNYSCGIYIPDAVAGIVLFANTGAPTSASPNYVRFEEDVTLVDMAVLAAPTATTAVFNSNGAQFAGNSILYGTVLYSATNRPIPRWTFRAGALIGAVNA